MIDPLPSHFAAWDSSACLPSKVLSLFQCPWSSCITVKCRVFFKRRGFFLGPILLFYGEKRACVSTGWVRSASLTADRRGDVYHAGACITAAQSHTVISLLNMKRGKGKGRSKDSGAGAAAGNKKLPDDADNTCPICYDADQGIRVYQYIRTTCCSCKMWYVI